MGNLLYCDLALKDCELGLGNWEVARAQGYIVQRFYRTRSMLCTYCLPLRILQI